MEYILSSEEMQASDAYTIENYVKSIDLMEKAGTACFEIIKNHIHKESNVLVVCGSGGNGGDGYVIARLLFEEKYNVKVFEFGSHLKEDTEINKNKYYGDIIDTFTTLDSKNLVIIDALLGVGINKQLRKDYKELIEQINKFNCYKISIDINSGIDATSGFSLGAYVKSDLTIAVNNYKLGHYFNDGVEAYKELIKADIGIKLSPNISPTKTLSSNDFKILFPLRNRNTNKGSYGKVALIGGSSLTPGAVNLSLNALASLRGGVGYSNVCIPKSLYNLFILKNSENIYTLLSDIDGKVIFVEEEIEKLLNYDAIAIGMGIGISLEVYKIISYLLSKYKGNLLLDADALNSISGYGVDILKSHDCNVILTPHLKEFSRLINISIDEIKKDYIVLAKSFASKYNLILNLKNDISVITDGEEVLLNINGNAGLAKGGSGDVLSGVTLSLLNKKTNLLRRVACGAYLLGKSADLAILDINEYSLIASDLSEYLINAFNSIINS